MFAISQKKKKLQDDIAKAVSAEDTDSLKTLLHSATREVLNHEHEYAVRFSCLMYI